MNQLAALLSDPVFATVGRVLVSVTGGSGFVGRTLLPHLREAGHTVRILRRPQATRRSRSTDLDETLEVDFGNARALTEALHGSDALIHLVGIIREFDVDTFTRVHVELTSRIVAAAGAAEVPHLVHMSALGTRREAVSRYHQTKWLGEQAVRGGHPTWTIFRPSLIFGAADEFTNVFARLARWSPIIPLMGGGKKLMQPIAVELVAQAFTRALTKPESRGETFDLVGPERMTFEAIVRAILAGAGRRRLLIRVPFALARAQAIGFETVFPRVLGRPAPLNRDQLAMLAEDNVGDGGPADQLFNLRHPPFAEAMAARFGGRLAGSRLNVVSPQPCRDRRRASRLSGRARGNAIRRADFMMRKPSLLVIFLTVFVDLVGFGIVLPLLPKYVKDFGAPGWMLGVIVASYSLMQFLFAPAWGRLSDRIGRRPVLLVSTAGFVLSYALFAIGSGLRDGPTALWVILASRVLSGACGANITVAQAYIADLTPPHERSKKMGLIGMAFGLGFICGPALAVVALLGMGLSGPGWWAAAICLVNLVLAYVFLGESRSKTGTAAPREGRRFDHWREVMQRPAVGLLITVFFLATLAFTCFETTLGLLIAQNFHFAKGSTDAEIAIAFLFAFSGFIGAFVQGGPIGRLVRSLGEGKLIALSLFLVAASLAPLPFFGGSPAASLSALWKDSNVSRLRFVGMLFTVGGPSWILLMATVSVLAIGSGLTRPPLFGLISILTPADEQGYTLGVAQGAGALARIAGPMFASATYAWHPSVPYFTCAGLSLIAGLLTWTRVGHRRSEPHATSPDAEPAR